MQNESDKTNAGDDDTPTQQEGEGPGPSVEELMPGLADAVSEEAGANAQAEIAALTAERDELKDQMLRALAELENTRRRAERDEKVAETRGGTRLARDLLAVHDNLERALDAADDSLREAHPGFLEGVELTRRELLNAFTKHKIEAVRPEKGEKFDPNRHQAMFEAPIPGAAPGTIIEVMQAGFVIADRMLRPALVGVAKAAPPAAPPADPAADPAPDPAPPEPDGGETPGGTE